MGVILLLGPSEWDPTRRKPVPPTPMDIRRSLAAVLTAERGHAIILLEDEKDRSTEDLVDKFDRILRTRGITDVVVWWPPGAKMQTTFDELLLLRDRVEPGLPRIWVVHHTSVATITADEFVIKEAGGRSRYLTALTRLRTRPIEWVDLDGLDRKIRFLANEIS
ncbi:MAG: hypothetical protein HY556_12050 [Euryarchaeota archaeon]|nr:hypothetical protein [Euryarchaeota archaeon]